MHRDEDVEDSASIHKCQKPKYSMLPDRVMLMECRSYRGFIPTQKRRSKLLALWQLLQPRICVCIQSWKRCFCAMLQNLELRRYFYQNSDLHTLQQDQTKLTESFKKRHKVGLLRHDIYATLQQDLMPL